MYVVVIIIVWCVDVVVEDGFVCCLVLVCKDWVVVIGEVVVDGYVVLYGKRNIVVGIGGGFVGVFCYLDFCYIWVGSG